MPEMVARRSNPLAPLTEAEIRTTRAPAEGRLVLRDPVCRGLELRISAPSVRYPDGTRSWSLEVRVAGRQRRFTICRYPELSLAEARKRAAKLRLEVLDGRDPVSERREARRKARLKRAGAGDVATVRTLLDSFERLFAKPRGLRTWRKARLNVEMNFAALLEKAPGELTRADLRAVLDAAVTRGAPISGKAAARTLRRILNWAVQRDLITNNPATGLDFDELTRPDKPRERILKDEEIARVWTAAEHRGRFGDLARLYLLTGLRRSELAGLRWGDIDGSFAVINNTKAGVPHRLPLSTAALALVSRQPHQGLYIFQLAGAKKSPALTVDWEYQRAKLQKASGVSGWTWHDLRRTCRTLLARIGVDDIVAELIINHAVPGKLRRTYNLHRYENEMREALERLAAFIARIVAGEANVTEPHPAGWAVPERTGA